MSFEDHLSEDFPLIYLQFGNVSRSLRNHSAMHGKHLTSGISLVPNRPLGCDVHILDPRASWLVTSFAVSHKQNQAAGAGKGERVNVRDKIRGDFNIFF